MNNVNHQVDLFSEPYEDASIQGVEYIPLNTNDTGVPGVGRQRFQIDTRDLDSYINYARSYLKVNCRIDADANGTALTAAQQAVLQNNGWSLFSKATLQINNTTIEEVEHCGVASSMRAYVEWSGDYKNSHGSNGGFFIDSSTQSGNGNNTGFAVRHSLATTSTLMTLMLPLSWVFGWCRDVDKTTKGLKFRLI